MDNLAKDAFLARQNGMSYGRYIAKYKPPKPPRSKVKKETEKLCQECGTEIPKDSKRRKFCKK